MVDGASREAGGGGSAKDRAGGYAGPVCARRAPGALPTSGNGREWNHQVFDEGHKPSNVYDRSEGNAVLLAECTRTPTSSITCTS